MNTLRNRLVSIALEWQKIYGVAPAITCSISEYDAAQFLGLDLEDYSKQMQTRTAVSKDYDFIFRNK